MDQALLPLTHGLEIYQVSAPPPPQKQPLCSFFLCISIFGSQSLDLWGSFPGYVVSSHGIFYRVFSLSLVKVE